MNWTPGAGRRCLLRSPTGDRLLDLAGGLFETGDPLRLTAAYFGECLKPPSPILNDPPELARFIAGRRVHSLSSPSHGVAHGRKMRGNGMPGRGAHSLASLPAANAAMRMLYTMRCRGCTMHMGMCTHAHTLT